MLLRVLIASGNLDLVHDTSAMVEDGDALVTVARDPEHMWTQLRSRPCDLLVVDLEFLGPRPEQELGLVQELPDSPESIVLLAHDDPDRRAQLLDGGAVACIASDIERHTLFQTIRALARRTKRLAIRGMSDKRQHESRLSDFASKSPSMQRFQLTVRKVVDSSSSLLVLGETGVGKEYLARALHREGPRHEGPFVAVNCGALPEGLLESELFGHVAGAFTGAQKSRRGYFELAHTGTIFLDEIAELPAHLQVKLLRVLQERSVQPVGSERTIEIDVRVIAATNRDLELELREKRFRNDLYYRLGVVTLTVPPLRERREDISDLVLSNLEHFRKLMSRSVFGIQRSAMDLLLRYGWPGNVRELINVVERAVLLAEGEEITPDDLPDGLRFGTRRTRVEVPADDGLTDVPLAEARERILESFERRYLEALLGETRGRIGEAALRAGVTPRTLYEKMKRLGLRKETFKSLAGGEART